MKHFVKIACLVLLFCVGDTVQAQDIPIGKKSVTTGELVAEKIIMYLPNRFAELFDIFSLDLETGATVKAGIRVTEGCGFGFAAGPSGVLSKDFNRQYGVSLNNDTQGYCLVLGKGEVERVTVAGNLKPFWMEYDDGLQPEDPVFRNGIRDYWAFDVRCSVLVGFRFAFHPRQLADFIAGIFFYDFLDNDTKSELF